MCIILSKRRSNHHVLFVTIPRHTFTSIMHEVVERITGIIYHYQQSELQHYCLLDTPVSCFLEMFMAWKFSVGYFRG